MTPVLVGLMLTASRTMLEFSEIHPATMKKAAEEISLGTSISQLFRDPPPIREIVLDEEVTS